MRVIEDYSGTSSALGMALEHFGRVEYPADGHISHHAHNHYEFCLLESGSLRYLIDDRSFAMSPGDICVTRPGEYHGMTGLDGPWTLTFINVRQMPLGELAEVFSSARARVLAGCHDLTSHFDDILAEARAGGFASGLAVHALTARLLVCMARRLRVAAPDVVSLPYTKVTCLAMEYIGASGTYATTIPDVARASGVSDSRLSHVFKAETGGTVRHHLRSVLMERARRMLEDDVFTVTEIAERLGFPGIACFSAFFRSHQGVAPTGYRRRCGG